MMKKIPFIALIALITFGFSGTLLFLLEKNTDKQTVFHKPKELPTEQFIQNHLLSEDGTIRTNMEGNNGHQLALSESLGLWMEYLVLKQDFERFEEAYDTLLSTFLLPEGLVAWKVENKERAQTNALIDDLRIMKALFAAGKHTNRKDFIKTAASLAQSLANYNRKGSDFVDFYDVRHRYANDEITLSYLDIESFRYMVHNGAISEEWLNDFDAFLHSITLKNGFYPKSYNVRTHTFTFENPVNLIDQLYTAIHFEKAGVKTDAFYEWLKAEFYRNERLYGRYDRIAKTRAVDYESASVYALTILYSLERNDRPFAKDVYERMAAMRVNDKRSNYYGGYVANGETHSFDNLLPLVAERIFLNETVE